MFQSCQRRKARLLKRTIRGRVISWRKRSRTLKPILARNDSRCWTSTKERSRKEKPRRVVQSLPFLPPRRCFWVCDPTPNAETCQRRKLLDFQSFVYLIASSTASTSTTVGVTMPFLVLGNLSDLVNRFE